VLITGTEENVKRSVNNLTDAKTLNARYLNVRDLLGYGKVIMPLSALEVIKEIWGNAQKAEG
jgi:large subunit ribosomal protein L4